MTSASGGQRNNSSIFSAGVLQANVFARTAVQLRGDRVELGLAAPGEVAALRPVLAQAAVRVLVRTALPWRVRVAEVDLDAGRDRERLGRRHPAALVPGQGAREVGGQCRDPLAQRVDDRVARAPLG